MQLNEYQEKAKETAEYHENTESVFEDISYTVLGLTNEAGEVAGVLKKFLRGDYTDNNESDWYKDVSKELGDVLWYLAMCASEFGYGLDEIAQMNLDKLSDRKNRGVIKGNGDNR